MVTRALLTLIAVLATGSAAADENDRDSVTLSRSELSLCGEATLRAFAIVHVGTSRLFLEDCQQTGLPLEPPLLLESTYSRALPARAFREPGETILQRNLDEEEWEALRESVEAFQQHYRDVEDGDRYALHYHSDGTLVLTLNDEPLARETGHDFAQAYLRIWFGERPFSRRLRDALLASD